MRISDWSSDVCSSDLLDYDDGFFGRYDSIYTDLKTYNIQSSAAYRLNDNFSIGGGVDVQYVKATLTNALPQLSPLAPTDGFARLKGDDWTVGWNAGLFYTNGDTNVGVSYRSGVNHKVTGTQRSEEHTYELQSLMRNSY